MSYYYIIITLTCAGGWREGTFGGGRGDAGLRLRITIVIFYLFCKTVAHRSIFGLYIVCASTV